MSKPNLSEPLAESGRVEAFSDGVFAMAITPRVFDLNASAGGGSLAGHVAAQWPSYVEFLVSITMIGIMWLNHHQMFHAIRGVDHGLIVPELRAAARPSGRT